MRNCISIPVPPHRTVAVEDVTVFRRDSGPADAPVVVVPHGFPTSSHMFRNPIPRLADRSRVIAPDDPGSGGSDAPDHETFAYPFGHFADIVDGPLSPDSRAFFRARQPPTLIVWGRNDTIVPADGASPSLRDLPDAERHLFKTGHFAPEDKPDATAPPIGHFLDRWVARS